jgi:glycosyltransferase involved in cell wall biosynthesis
MSSYFKQDEHQTYVFSYQRDGHAQQDVAQFHSAIQEGVHKNKFNNLQLQDLIEKIQPHIVINQMPYEREIGVTLSEVHKKQNFLLLGCLRNTLFTVKLNLPSYSKAVVPKYIQPLFNNFLGKQILLFQHTRKHKKDLQFILDTYDYFVMFGPPNIQELKYFVGDYKLDKTHLIPNSILSVLTEVPPKEKRILWLSRLGYGQKRADLIIPFWKKVMNELPDWEFDIVGDGNAYNDLKQQIEKENIPRVTLYGKQLPYDYYKRSPIYIMTSENEGFPNTLIEAQSFGAIPVVYDNYPICSWVVKDGKSGVLITPFKVDEMANQVISIARDQNRQNQLMQAAIENAREFEINKVGKKWVDFFNSQLIK